MVAAAMIADVDEAVDAGRGGTDSIAEQRRETICNESTSDAGFKQFSVCAAEMAALAAAEITAGIRRCRLCAPISGRLEPRQLKHVRPPRLGRRQTLVASIATGEAATATSVEAVEIETKQKVDLVGVCTNKTCKRDGSLQVVQYFRELAPPSIRVESRGCTGKCGSGPNVILMPDGMIVSHVNTMAHVARLLELQCNAPPAELALKVMDLRSRANAAFERGDLDLAEQLYTEAIEIGVDSTSAVLYSNRSALRLQQGRAEEALEDGRQAAARDQTWGKAHLRVARALLALGDTTAAKEAFRVAKSLDMTLEL